MESDDCILSDIHSHFDLSNGTFSELVLHLDLPYALSSRPFPSEFRLKFQSGTSLEFVGQQLWAGTLLLVEFILNFPELFVDKNIVELGSGLGLVGQVLASLGVNQIVCTDYAQEVLSMCEANIVAHTRLYNLSSEVAEVRTLDWLDPNSESPHAEQAFLPFKMDSRNRDTSCFLAADVIYDDEITDAFLKTVVNLLQNTLQPAALYLTLEKRINFSLKELKVVAESYDYLFDSLQSDEYNNILRAVRLPTDFPQIIVGYERTKQMELWKLDLRSRV